MIYAHGFLVHDFVVVIYHKFLSKHVVRLPIYFIFTWPELGQSYAYSIFMWSYPQSYRYQAKTRRSTNGVHTLFDISSGNRTSYHHKYIYLTYANSCRHLEKCWCVYIGRRVQVYTVYTVKNWAILYIKHKGQNIATRFLDHLVKFKHHDFWFVLLFSSRTT